MDVTSSPWKIEVICLACVNHPYPHTALANLDRAKLILDDWDLDVSVLIAATQDTTGSSIATFQTIESTEIIPCYADTAQLFIQHSCDKVPIIKDTIESMNKCATKIRGYPKRVQELFRICKEVNIKQVMPRKIHITRWDIREKVATRTLELLPAYKEINAEEVFDKLDAREVWINALNDVDVNADVIKEILPLMKLNAQWTQILSSRNEVTISLVRLAIRSLRKAVDTINDKAILLLDGFRENRSLSTLLLPIYNSANKYVDCYFGDDFYNYGLLRIAEFLDTRTVWCIEDSHELKKVIKSLKLIANFSDITTTSTSNINGNSSGLLAASASRKSPLEVEVDLYTNYMVQLKEVNCNSLNPLEWWAKEGCIAFPILAGIAARVLSIPATSASVEQLFSVAGRVVTTARASLNSRHVNELCSLHQWLIDDGMITKEAAAELEKRAKTTKSFAFLNLRREVEDPDILDSDEEDDDDENFDN